MGYSTFQVRRVVGKKTRLWRRNYTGSHVIKSYAHARTSYENHVTILNISFGMLNIFMLGIFKYSIMGRENIYIYI